MTPAAQSLVAEAMHGKQAEAPANSSPGAAQHEERGQASGEPVPQPSGKDILKLSQIISFTSHTRQEGKISAALQIY